MLEHDIDVYYKTVLDLVSLAGKVSRKFPSIRRAMFSLGGFSRIFCDETYRDKEQYGGSCYGI